MFIAKLPLFGAFKSHLLRVIVIYWVTILSWPAVGMPPPVSEPPMKAKAQALKANETAVATFAGGCFWCMEKPFDEIPGVISTISGYTGGHKENPSYKDVSKGITGHYEVVQITYKPAEVSFDQLLEVFWVNIDPLDSKGQFCDKGQQYLSAIFYHDESQKKSAEKSLNALAASEKLDGKIVTPILPAAIFYPAEDYHQDYYKRNPWRYKYYRHGCGRDKRLKQLWGKQG